MIREIPYRVTRERMISQIENSVGIYGQDWSKFPIGAIERLCSYCDRVERTDSYNRMKKKVLGE